MNRILSFLLENQEQTTTIKRVFKRSRRKLSTVEKWEIGILAASLIVVAWLLIN
jgi:cell division protein FtsL